MARSTQPITWVRLYNLPGGGPGLAEQTVNELLGVDINYYAQIDFSAFENFIDQIGGIDVEVPYELTVDPIGPGNTVTLPAGRPTPGWTDRPGICPQS